MSEFKPYEYALDENALYMDLSPVMEHAQAEVEERCADFRMRAIEILGSHNALIDNNGFAYYQFHHKAYGDTVTFLPGVDDAFMKVAAESASQPTQILMITNELLPPNSETQKQGVITKEFVLSSTNKVNLHTSSVVVDLESSMFDGHTEGYGSPLLVPKDKEHVLVAFMTQLCGEEVLSYEADGEKQGVYTRRFDSPHDSLDALSFAENICERLTHLDPVSASRRQQY